MRFPGSIYLNRKFTEIKNFLINRNKFKRKSEKRPGRDLNPGQKLRRLLGCPLPYRGKRTFAITRTKCQYNNIAQVNKSLDNQKFIFIRDDFSPQIIKIDLKPIFWKNVT
jgi:hypothetical protein